MPLEGKGGSPLSEKSHCDDVNEEAPEYSQCLVLIIN